MLTQREVSTYVELLKSGGVLACPTETQHGLLADALNASAVARVVELKRRGADPIALLLPDRAALALVSDAPLSELASALADTHWPGPLTLVVRARASLAPALAPLGTVGVRVPGESPALSLVRAFAGPLTATSCNPSGAPPAVTENAARAYFEGQLAGFVPGAALGGLPSTVVDVTGDVPRVLRQGAVVVAI